MIQATDSTGRFTTVGQITDRRALGYVARQRERLVDRRNVALRAANTPASRAAADALPMEVDRNFVLELQERRRRMLEIGITSEDAYFGPDGWDSWDDWRDDLVGSYEQVSG